ncbi:aminopeptidase N [Phycisphaerales bacterium]|nr:aminopeptidase N [Phycisphaerales bacterium]
MVRRFLPLLATLALSTAAPAQDDDPDPRIDLATMREAATWPPDRPFDHLHMRLEVDIPDINKPELSAIQTLTLTPVAQAQKSLILDCRGPSVQSVTSSGIPLFFEQSDGKLRIHFPAPVSPGQTVAVVTTYTLDFSKNRGDGLTFSKGREDAESPTRKVTQIHAQGQAQLNSLWFPCHDYPNERLTTELLVTVADGFDVVSNGHLAARETIPDTRVRWHWVQDKPHVYYLVTLAIGKFAIVDVGGPDSARPGLPMPVYVTQGDEENVKDIFGATPAMVAFFEKTFGEPYPWDKYAQVCVRSFSAGGMENTSCTLLTEGTSRVGEAGSRDDLISHELAHQWTGDLMTCKGWAHLWLNEGWASYAECLWNEHKAGEDQTEAHRAYHRSVLNYVRAQRMRNRGSAPTTPPIVSNRYTDPDSVFRKRDDPYAKGAMILHMLRERLGDHAFFGGVRDYVQTYKFSCVETDDFRRCLERASGQSLERFFAQWCYRPGLPRLAVDLDWNEESKSLNVAIEQTQTINPLNPAYSLAVPIRVKFEDESFEWIDLVSDQHQTAHSFTLKAKPVQVSVDPNITCFSAVETRKPLAWWLDEAAKAPTLYARLQAVDALAAFDIPEAKALLANLADNEGEDFMLREAAVDLSPRSPLTARLSPAFERAVVPLRFVNP